MSDERSEGPSLNLPELLGRLGGGDTKQALSLAQQIVGFAQTVEASHQRAVARLELDVVLWRERAENAEQRIRELELEVRNIDLRRLERALRGGALPELCDGDAQAPLQVGVSG